MSEGEVQGWPRQLQWKELGRCRETTKWPERWEEKRRGVLEEKEGSIQMFLEQDVINVFDIPLDM